MFFLWLFRWNYRKPLNMMTFRVRLCVRPSLWTWGNQTGKHPAPLFCICQTPCRCLDNLQIFKLVFFCFFVPVRYSHGPTPLQSQHYTTSQDIMNSISVIQQEMRNYKPRLTQVHQWEVDVDLWVNVWNLHSRLCFIFWPGLGDVKQCGELRHHSAVTWRSSDAGRRPTDH